MRWHTAGIGRPQTLEETVAAINRVLKELEAVLNTWPKGTEGNVQFEDGAAGVSAVSVFNYNASAARLSVPNLTVTSALAVTGALSADGALFVSGAATLDSTLAVSAGATVGTLSADSATVGTLSADSATIGALLVGTLSVAGAVFVSAGATIGGALSADGALFVSGAATLDSTLAVSGTATLGQHRVLVTMSVGQSIQSGVSTVLSFDVETFDVGSMHDNATNNSRLTVTVNGLYWIYGLIAWNTTLGDGIQSQASIRRNGATTLAVEMLTDPGTAPPDTGVGILAELVSTDYVELLARHDAGTNRTLLVRTKFMALKVA